MTSRTPKNPGDAKLEGSGEVAQLHIDPNGGKGEYRRFGGSKHDDWNQALITQIVGAMPRSAGAITVESADASQGLIAGQMDLNPQDPAEAMLTAQMIAANAAALELYRRAWISDQNFDVRAKYLALADKAGRTVALLSDTLDRHRGRGQQQILVKHQHVTVHADQAVVADTVVNGHGRPGGGDGNGKSNQPHALAHAPGDPLQGAFKKDREAVPVACS